MKKIIIFLILFVFVSIIFAERNELWNGFYEDMTPSQVSARVKEVLHPIKINDVIKGENAGRDDFNYNEGDIDMPYTRFIEVKTNNEAYMQKTYYGMSPSHQIRFCFYENKLFHIQVLYNLTGNDVVAQLRKKYGECIQKTKVVFEDWSYCYEYVFKSANSETFVRYLNYGETVYYDSYFVHYYNPKYKSEYEKQMLEKKERERLHELERIKRIEENAVF